MNYGDHNTPKFDAVSPIVKIFTVQYATRHDCNWQFMPGRDGVRSHECLAFAVNPFFGSFNKPCVLNPFLVHLKSPMFLAPKGTVIRLRRLHQRTCDNALAFFAQ